MKNFFSFVSFISDKIASDKFNPALRFIIFFPFIIFFAVVFIFCGILVIVLIIFTIISHIEGTDTEENRENREIMESISKSENQDRDKKMQKYLFDLQMITNDMQALSMALEIEIENRIKTAENLRKEALQAEAISKIHEPEYKAFKQLIEGTFDNKTKWDFWINGAQGILLMIMGAVISWAWRGFKSWKAKLPAKKQYIDVNTIPLTIEKNGKSEES